MANSSIILSSLDFDTLKATFKQYLRTQDKFSDYDFDGSNMNVLLDILAYNTYHNAFYLNMVGNEMFLDTAQLRSSVISHAKELNYLPASFTSARANVNITVTSNQINERSVVVAKDTPFVSRTGYSTYIFSTNENIVISDYVIEGNTITFSKNNINIYEGYFVNDTFVYTYPESSRMILSNKTADISSVSVTVIEDAGANVVTYKRATSLFNLNADSKVFFIQPAGEDSYEIVFGDGVTGRRPKNQSSVIIEYRVCNGELPNGVREFKVDTGYIKVGGVAANAVVSVNEPATGGSVSESIDSIRYNAPRAFTTQERAVTSEDYENLLKLNFPEINVVSAYGGENLNPPQYGKVFVSVDLNDVDQLPEIKKKQYTEFLTSRSPTSIQPVFVDPEYTYINVISNVNYNINTSALTTSDIETIVVSNVLRYAESNLNDFNRTFRYSKLINSIDSSHVSVVSNETNIKLYKIRTPSTARAETFDLNFSTPLEIMPATSEGGRAVKSQSFEYNNVPVFVSDNGTGVLYLYTVSNEQPLINIGTVDYETGLLQISNLKVDRFTGSGIKFYVVPRNKDITTTRNVIINIVEEDVDITATAVRV